MDDAQDWIQNNGYVSVGGINKICNRQGRVMVHGELLQYSIFVKFEIFLD